MPLYRYKCTQCKEEFTRLVSLTNGDKIKCEKCGSLRLEKLLPRFISGRTKEGALIGGNSCSTCQASSCTSCGR